MDIKLDLSLEQVNKIVSVLSEKPFAEVNELIFEIKAQGQAQYDQAQEESPDGPN